MQHHLICPQAPAEDRAEHFGSGTECDVGTSDKPLYAFCQVEDTIHMAGNGAVEVKGLGALGMHNKGVLVAWMELGNVSKTVS